MILCTIKISKQCKGFTAEAINAAYQHFGEYPRDDDVTLIVG